MSPVYKPKPVPGGTKPRPVTGGPMPRPVKPIGRGTKPVPIQGKPKSQIPGVVQAMKEKMAMKAEAKAKQGK